ncbi:hypothetical protein [Larsenimonas suaedae]|uniref:Uncharacterized protein n=1 Tax=Larsenimonas suaedae TaxID=1851019 RepID=A0ABU1GYY4_9GAMM|nr:hypothetical protein [Larsenimonas suaedae]MCM2973751.1 hypothetical protein [Larsenimonas suaedae]MDR5897275.1 hypothetical protein [Larsenimonas suaedae]
MNPTGTHPYTHRPNHRYLTVVLEKLDDATNPDSLDDLFDSMKNDTESTSLAGVRVTAISIGDEVSAAEDNDEHE